MKNIEKYKDEIIEKMKNGYPMQCLVRKAAYESCSELSCTECKMEMFDWLLAEYKEPQKLTKNDVELLKTLQNEYSEIRISNSGYTILHRGSETEHIYLNGYFEHLQKNHTHNIKVILENYVEV